MKLVGTIMVHNQIFLEVLSASQDFYYVTNQIMWPNNHIPLNFSTCHLLLKYIAIAISTTNSVIITILMITLIFHQHLHITYSTQCLIVVYLQYQSTIYISWALQSESVFPSISEIFFLCLWIAAWCSLIIFSWWPTSSSKWSFRACSCWAFWEKKAKESHQNCYSYKFETI